MVVPVAPIAGCPGAGKTLVAQAVQLIVAAAGLHPVRFPLERYYRPYNLNHYNPASLDMELVSHDLRRLQAHEMILPPNYDPRTRRRSKNEGGYVAPGDLIVIDHPLALALFSLEYLAKIAPEGTVSPDYLGFYVQADLDACHGRFIEKQTRPREEGGYGRSRIMSEVSWRYHVLPAFIRHIEPTSDNATKQIVANYSRPEVGDNVAIYAPQVLDLCGVPL